MRRIKPVPTFLLFVTIISIAAYVLRSRSARLSSLHPQPKADQPMAGTATPLPTPQVTSWLSPDGKKMLTLTEVASGSGRMVEVIVTPQDKKTEDVLVFSQMSDPQVAYRIPFNSWSPDNMYVFLEKKMGSKSDFLVLLANGKKFRTGSSTLDVLALFEEKLPDYSLKEVTGWAAPTLLIVNARPTEKNPNGVSFWLDVTSGRFTRLSSNFN